MLHFFYSALFNAEFNLGWVIKERQGAPGNFLQKALLYDAKRETVGCRQDEFVSIDLKNQRLNP
jgi:hypothetical protein